MILQKLSYNFLKKSIVIKGAYVIIKRYYPLNKPGPKDVKPILDQCIGAGCSSTRPNIDSRIIVNNNTTTSTNATPKPILDNTTTKPETVPTFLTKPIESIAEKYSSTNNNTETSRPEVVNNSNHDICSTNNPITTAKDQDLTKKQFPAIHVPKMPNQGEPVVGLGPIFQNVLEMSLTHLVEPSDPITPAFLEDTVQNIKSTPDTQNNKINNQLQDNLVLYNNEGLLKEIHIQELLALSTKKTQEIYDNEHNSYTKQKEKLVLALEKAKGALDNAKFKSKPLKEKVDNLQKDLREHENKKLRTMEEIHVETLNKLYNEETKSLRLLFGPHHAPATTSNYSKAMQIHKPKEKKLFDSYIEESNFNKTFSEITNPKVDIQSVTQYVEANNITSDQQYEIVIEIVINNTELTLLKKHAICALFSIDKEDNITIIGTGFLTSSKIHNKDTGIPTTMLVSEKQYADITSEKDQRIVWFDSPIIIDHTQAKINITGTVYMHQDNINNKLIPMMHTYKKKAAINYPESEPKNKHDFAENINGKQESSTINENELPSDDHENSFD